jgi:hypothetical protein
MLIESVSEISRPDIDFDIYSRPSTPSFIKQTFDVVNHGTPVGQLAQAINAQGLELVVPNSQPP